MQEESWLQWLSSNTPTRWWHDSANPDEIDAALARGALGVTTNPVLTYKTLQAHPEHWGPEVREVPQTLQPEERAEALLKIVATSAARKVAGIHQASSGAHGYALGQLNPSNAGDADAMLRQAERVHGWAPNMMVKLPATRAGLEVTEELASRGIASCVTINISVAQAIAVGERHEKGAQRAEGSGITPGLCLVVQQVGRLDDFLRDVAHDLGAGLSESDITQAGIAVMKRSYEIFTKRKYRSVIMPAGLRGTNQAAEMAGAAVVFSLHPRVQSMIDHAVLPREERAGIPVEPRVVARLMKLREFVRAYEPEGMLPEEFLAHGLTQRILSQFLETGWAPLETYGSDLPSSRWT